MMTVIDSGLPQDPRLARIAARDKTADGSFWYSVRTTGVYCRPSCPSRAARPENMILHASLADARASGARPCRRCNPDGASIDTENAAMIERACRRIEAADACPSLAALSEEAELSPGHFHRLFKAATGLTPRGYAAARRGARLRDRLASGSTVTAAAHDAGFGSSARLYADAPALLGMAPSRYAKGGFGETLSHAFGTSTLGLVLVAVSERGIASIMLGDDADALLVELRGRFPAATLVPAEPDVATMVEAIVALVEEPGRGLDLPLDIRGTAFQQRVWDALRRIPLGTTATYTDIARAIGAPDATRAVAGACAANHLAVVIPCHRVVRQDGALSGYRWGTARKRALIDREAGVERLV